MNVLTTDEFEDWFSELGPWGQAQVGDRLDRIRDHSHFGDTKFLGSRLWEMRWRSGRRVYYALVGSEDGKVALMLVGGDKNGQDRDIAQARRILERQLA